MPTAIDRPGYTGGNSPEELAAFFTEQRRRNPAFQAPAGYEWKGDHYERDTHGVLDTMGKYAPLVGLGIGGASAAGAFGGAAGASGAGGGMATAGVPAGLPGAVDLGSLGLGGATSGGGGILGWLKNPANWSNLLGIGGDVGSVLGKQAQGAAEGRHVEALLENQRDAIRNQQYGTAQNAQFNAGSLDLARKGFSETARGNRGKQAVTGNLLSNLQDLSINIPGIQNATVNGGLKASALGGGGRAAASEMAKQAMLALLSGDEFTGGEVLTPPQLSATPQPSGWENAAGIGGILGSLGGALGDALGRPRGQQPRPITSTVLPRRV